MSGPSLLSLNGGHSDCVDDVPNQGPSGEVVGGFCQTLENWTYGRHIGGPLNRLVGSVSGVQIRKDKNCGPPGNLTIADLDSAYFR